MAQQITEVPVRKINGQNSTLGDYLGKVMLVVNVASKCGLTPQYEGLERIYKKYRDQGLVVLGFPANEFAGQEPGTNTEIEEFCQMNYGVSFPMFEKIVVKGEGQHPLYKMLVQTKPTSMKNANSNLEQRLQEKGLLSGQPEDIKWNFEKFLIDRKGSVVARFAPDVTPEDPMVIKAIETALG